MTYTVSSGTLNSSTIPYFTEYKGRLISYQLSYTSCRGQLKSALSYHCEHRAGSTCSSSGSRCLGGFTAEHLQWVHGVYTNKRLPAELSIVAHLNSYRRSVQLLLRQHLQQIKSRQIYLPRWNITRNSSIADKPAQRVYRSVEVTKHSTVPYVDIVSYCAIVTLSLRRAVFTIFDFRNVTTLKSGS